MGLYIQMSRDIREYSPKVMGGLTRRQIICIALGMSYGVPVMLALPLGIEAKIFAGVAVMAPVLACGWITMFGMPLERFLFKCFFPAIFRSGARKYKTQNTFSFLMETNEPPNKIKRSRQYRSTK